MLSINKLQDGQLKDTAAHILRSKEFVVHLADEPIAAAMHRCGDRLPVHESELAYTGLSMTPRTACRCLALPKRPRHLSACCTR